MGNVSSSVQMHNYVTAGKEELRSFGNDYAPKVLFINLQHVFLGF